ncbi:pyridoxamine 5'-phosphate oxidase family protein [Microbaculum marinum]|uniref:Pyridoxamine 5'-phosphate oxidase family protein n=1 Tax=Microbaculum marinum TaxID=1764581 RepID=A0AAW9RQA4_9HYPH
MSDHETVDRVWKLMEKIGFCMLASRDGDDIRSRPMAAHVARDEHAVYFLTDVHGHKDEEIRQSPHVCLAFADPDDQDYVSVSGTAIVSNDREKIKTLWSTPAKAWWDDPEDPSIRILKVTPNDAQYWDGPGTIAAYARMIAAAVSGDRPDMGDQAKVRM